MQLLQLKYQEYSSHRGRASVCLSARLEEEFCIHYQLSVLVITFGLKEVCARLVQVEERVYLVFERVSNKSRSWIAYILLVCLSCQNIIQVENANCICVDWKGGSRTGYTQATQNVQIVGAEIAYLVKALQVSASCFLKKPHPLLPSTLLPKENSRHEHFMCQHI